MGIEDAGLHVILKKIIKNDKNRLEANDQCETFGSLLVKAISTETLEKWLTVNRACFVLLNIVENNNEQTKNELRNRMEPLRERIFGNETEKEPQQQQQQQSNGLLLLKKKLYDL